MQELCVGSLGAPARAGHAAPGQVGGQARPLRPQPHHLHRARAALCGLQGHRPGHPRQLRPAPGIPGTPILTSLNSLIHCNVRLSKLKLKESLSDLFTLGQVSTVTYGLLSSTLWTSLIPWYVTMWQWHYYDVMMTHWHTHARSTLWTVAGDPGRRTELLMEL